MALEFSCGKFVPFGVSVA
uniref:Uncharacterized protein n=1 Tax=Arundo donax TaxID=35708 RepID=A0A0A8YFY1_ARUDO